MGGEYLIRSIIITIIVFTLGYKIANLFRNQQDTQMDDDLFMYLVIASSVMVVLALQGARVVIDFIQNLLF